MGPKKKDLSTPTDAKRRTTNRKWNPVPKDSSSGSDSDDIEVCPVCQDKNDPNNKDNKNRMIGCDGCDKWFHWSCVGVTAENKPKQDEDWFCKRCTSKKEEAVAWKPEKMDKLPDVLPARSTPRGKRGGGGGSKSETKRRGRPGTGKKEVMNTSRSLGGTPRSPSPEIILTPVKETKKQEKMKKASQDLFGSKKTDEKKSTNIPSGLSMTPVNNPASNSKHAKLPTPAKNQLMKTHQSLTMTPVKVQMKKLNNPVITIPDNDDNVNNKPVSSISITLDSDDSDSDIEDDLLEPNEGLQNSTISSSGSEIQEQDASKDSKRPTSNTVQIGDNSDDEIITTMTKSANKNLTKSSKTGRITPLKINLKNVTSTSSDKKRKESSDLGSPTAKKAKTIIDSASNGLSLEDDDASSLAPNIGDQSFDIQPVSVKENVASKSGELNLPVVSENNAITDDNTNYKDMDDGIESILENISQQGAVSISDAKDSENVTGAAQDMFDNVDLDKLGDDENNFSDLLKMSDNTGSTTESAVDKGSADNTGSTTESAVNRGSADNTGSTTESAIDKGSANNTESTTDSAADKPTNNPANHSSQDLNQDLHGNRKSLGGKSNNNKDNENNSSGAQNKQVNRWESDHSSIRDMICNSDDALKNVVGGEKDSVDNLSVKAATPKKKTYSWEIEENKSPSYGDHMYHRTEGTAPASETLSRHNLPQTVDQPNTFTKLQELMQQSSAVAAGSSAGSTNNSPMNATFGSSHTNISRVLSQEEDMSSLSPRPLTISEDFPPEETNLPRSTLPPHNKTSTSSSHGITGSSPSVGLLSPNSNVSQGNLGFTIEKVGDAHQATSTRKSLEGLFNNSSSQQLQRSSHRVGSFSSISSADSGSSAVAGQLSPQIRVASPLSLQTSGTTSPLAVRTKEPISAPLRPAVSQPLRQFQISGLRAVRQTSTELKTVPGSAPAPSSTEIRPQVVGISLEKTLTSSTAVAAILSTATTTSKSVPSSNLPGYMYPLCGRLAPPKPTTMPPLIPNSTVSSSMTVANSNISSPITLVSTSSLLSVQQQSINQQQPHQSINQQQPQQSINQQQSLLSISTSSQPQINNQGNTNYQSGVNNSLISNVNNLHMIRSNNLQTTGSNNSTTRMSLAPVVGSPPGRMTLASPGRIQIASNLQANSAIIGNENIHQTSTSQTYDIQPSIGQQSNYQVEQSSWNSPALGAESQNIGVDPTQQSNQGYVVQPGGLGDVSPQIRVAAPMRGVRGVAAGVTRGVRMVAGVQPRIRPPRGTGPRVRGGIIRGVNPRGGGAPRGMGQPRGGGPRPRMAGPRLPPGAPRPMGGRGRGTGAGPRARPPMGGPTAPQPRPHLVSQQQPQPRLPTANLQQQAQPGLIYQRQQAPQRGSTEYNNSVPVQAQAPPAAAVPVQQQQVPPVIKIEDDEDEITMIGEVTPTPEKKKTVDRLKKLGLTVIRSTETTPPPKKKTTEFRNLNLPPGISLSPAVEDTDSSRRGRDSERGSTYTTSNSVTSASNSSEDTPRFLDLNNLSVDKIAQLKALGIL